MDALIVPPEWPASTEAYAQHVASGAARGFAAVLGVDPGAPEGDQGVTVEVRRGELGEIDRFRIVPTPRAPVLANHELRARQQQAERQRRALGWQQLRQHLQGRR